MSELDIYARQGLGNSSGFGERPALLIVDFVNVLTVVVAGGVGDRAIAPHEATLFDMDWKYADLMTCEEVARKLDGTASAAEAMGVGESMGGIQ